MIECPPFPKDTPIYHAMLHIIYFLTTLVGIFIVVAVLFKCPKRVKGIKYQLIALMVVGDIGIFLLTEGKY